MTITTLNQRELCLIGVHDWREISYAKLRLVLSPEEAPLDTRTCAYCRKEQEQRLCFAKTYKSTTGTNPYKHIHKWITTKNPLPHL